MSWNIFIYAEVKGKDNADWKPLVIPAVCDNFKYLNDGFVDELPSMSSKEASHPTVKNLSGGLLNSDFKVQYCTVSELRKHYYNVVKSFNSKFESTYLALGLKVRFDDEDFYDIDDCEETSNCNNCSYKCIFNRMSFPVNKDFLKDLFVSTLQCQKAYNVLGMCDTIDSICENYNDEVRLLFATL